MTDVVKNALKIPGRQQVDLLVMSAPTVEITNLDTSKLQPSDDTEYFQQKTTLSSQNMFGLAEKSIRQK